MNKISLKAYLIALIVFVVYSVVVFVAPFARGGLFWLAYFLTLAFLALASFIFDSEVVRKGNHLSRVFGWPVWRVARIGTLVQLILSLAIMATTKWVPAFVGIILEVLLAGATGIGLLKSTAMEDIIRDAESEEYTRGMREMRSTVRALLPRCPALSHLSERLAASDPVSDGQDGELEQAIGEIKAKVLSGNQEGVEELITRTEYLLQERNERVRNSKRQSR